MRFLANENFPVASTRVLRAAGHEVVAVTLECPGISDEAVLKLAANEQLVILTFDRDYGDLIFRRGLSSPAGLIYLRLDPISPTEPAEIILRLLTANRIPI